jgi:DNA-binding MarR family transcriptional regulator
MLRAPNAARPTPARRGSDIDLGDLPQHIGYIVRRAQVAIFQHIIRAMAPLNVRPGQFSVLMVIEANPGLKQTAISEALGIRRANLVSLVGELERRGWVQRAAVTGDRRAQGLRLTSRGRAALARLKVLAARHERRVTRTISAREKRDLLRLLARVSDAAK